MITIVVHLSPEEVFRELEALVRHKLRDEAVTLGSDVQLVTNVTLGFRGNDTKSLDSWQQLSCLVKCQAEITAGTDVRVPIEPEIREVQSRDDSSKHT